MSIDIRGTRKGWTIAVAAAALLVANASAALGQTPPQYKFRQILGLTGAGANLQDINNNGVISGNAYSAPDQGCRRACIWDASGCHLLGGQYQAGNSCATAINDSGQAVGYLEPLYGSTFGPMAAYQWNGGVAAAMGDGTYAAFDINNAGAIIGRLTVGMNQGRGFIYQQGALSVLPTLGGDKGIPYDINELGDYCGFSNSANGTPTHAFLNRRGTMIDLGTVPGQAYSEAIVVNDLDQVLCRSGTQTYLWQDGQVTVLTAPVGWSNLILNDMNNRGQIVGQAIIDGRQRAVLYDNGLFYDLNNLMPPNSLLWLNCGNGINEVGQIVGAASLYTGPSASFELTPVPEPATMTLLGLGLVGLLGRRWKGK